MLKSMQLLYGFMFKNCQNNYPAVFCSIFCSILSNVEAGYFKSGFLYNGDFIMRSSDHH